MVPLALVKMVLILDASNTKSSGRPLHTEKNYIALLNLSNEIMFFPRAMKKCVLTKLISQN